ncbi:TonB family protein [Spirosoma foliorum]|uniref:TonB family protein n=1 Tax=Spirosoma foliorum TaxID=2710596 RepID=A0A7G5GWW0_9BACT|nr:TonB family protein [Spirosoma foliorum]QMW03352.1 TonB family protein [Spirosoma foliorum]
MKILLSLFLLFCCSIVSAQQDVYQSFEVDSAATPRGGVTTFNTFLQANLRKPIAAAAKGIGGIVVLNGIVEADGCITGVKLVESFRPDCDREAMRVLKLFNAWKPARKARKEVRQEVIIPVNFKENTPFIYENGTRISYFDVDYVALMDTTQAYYKQYLPIDSMGIPTGDIMLYKMKKGIWKKEAQSPLFRKVLADLPREKTYSIGYQNGIVGWEGDLFVVDNKGKLLRQSYFRKGQQVGAELFYHSNGLVSEMTETLNDKSTITTWYSNGQINQVKLVDPPQGDFSYAYPEQVIALWDSTGHQKIKDGNGYGIYQTRIQSAKDTTQYTLFIEQGVYKNGYKQGVWTGKYADSSYFYNEVYDKGVCKDGKARAEGEDSVNYTEIEEPAQFSGGIQSLDRFLKRNSKYPIGAVRIGVEGRVFVGFSVCTDGTLCNYELLKSVRPDLDQEALRVVKKTSGYWIPANLRGRKVQTKYKMPINFTLN